MNYEQKYKEKYEGALERARELSKTVTGANYEYIFPELKESEDERIRKGLVKAFGTIGKKDWGGLIVRDILAWLEKQGEQTQLDYEHVDIPQKDFAPIEHKTLNADEVIEWLKPYNEIVGNITKQFKKDFGL